MKTRRIPFTPILMAALIACCAGGAWFGHLLAAPEDSEPRLEGRMREYAELLQALEEWAPAEIGSDELVYGSIHGLMKKLDPHSQFFAPVDYSEVRDRHTGSYYGVGLVVTQRENRVVVVTPMEGGPAGRLGVRPGDVIIEVDGISTETLPYDRVSEMLRGPRGVPVEVRVMRQGFDEPIAFTIVREAILSKAVSADFMIEPGTGYVRVNDFTNNTEREFDQAIARLQEQGLERVIVDLRGNGGGVLGAAIAIADRFLEKDQMVVFTRGNLPSSHEEYAAPGTKPRLQIPVVVLVDEGSASASEIVAGAIQDHDRGLVVGETTWGKGLVQSVYNLRHGAGIALTTSRYYTPSGRNIQRDYTSLYDYYGHGDDPSPAALPTFTTTIGRTVYGGGGIHPDIEAERAERPRIVQRLEARGVAFDFAVRWNAEHPDAHPEAPESAMLEMFQQMAIEREVVDPALLAGALADTSVRAHVLRMIQAELASVRDGYAASYPFRLKGDAQIAAAIAALPEAEKLASQAASKRRQDFARRQAATDHPS